MLFESDGAHQKPVGVRRKMIRHCGFDSSKEPTHRQGYRCLLGRKRLTQDVGNVNGNSSLESVSSAALRRSAYRADECRFRSCSSFSSRCSASIMRTVPEADLMTSVCVVAPVLVR